MLKWWKWGSFLCWALFSFVLLWLRGILPGLWAHLSGPRKSTKKIIHKRKSAEKCCAKKTWLRVEVGVLFRPTLLHLHPYPHPLVVSNVTAGVVHLTDVTNTWDSRCGQHHNTPAHHRYLSPHASPSTHQPLSYFVSAVCIQSTTTTTTTKSWHTTILTEK